MNSLYCKIYLLTYIFVIFKIFFIRLRKIHIITYCGVLLSFLHFFIIILLLLLKLNRSTVVAQYNIYSSNIINS